MFELLADVATRPAFAADEMERLRQRRLVALTQQKDSPTTLAVRVFYRELYGGQSPYGYVDTGTEPATTATTRDDILAFYKAGYGPKNAVLSVAGDLTTSQLKELTTKYFGGWTGEATTQPPLKIDARGERKIVIVDKPGTNQSALRIGQIGLPRSNPDYVPVRVMNDILGGLFSSRINLNLREVHGYTYGAGTSYQFRRAQGPFAVSSMVRADATAPAIAEVLKELNRMRSSQPVSEEVAMAKESYLRSLTATFETTQQTAGTMAELFVYDLPLTYYSDLPKKIEAVDAGMVQQMAEKYLAPDNMVIVVVGDRQKIEEDVRKLNIGPVQTQDADGKPLEARKTEGAGAR